MTRSAFITLGLLAALLSISGCAERGDRQRSGPLRIVATTSMIADAVREVAGDRVELTALMGPGVDPHLYKATKGDLDHLTAADLVLYNGLHLEAKLGGILEKMGGTKAVVPVTEEFPASRIRYADSTAHTPDPHIWFDLSLWQLAVKKVASTLVGMDSANAQFYIERAAAYDDSIGTLHTWVRQEIQTIPERQRVLVTAHDAFGYFGAAYGIEVRGLQGISTVTEAGLYDVTHMIDLLVERRIKAVFVESSVPRKSIEAVVSGCRGRGHEITIGGQLYSDAMGEASTPEGTYLGMVRSNVNTIVSALK